MPSSTRSTPAPSPTPTAMGSAISRGSGSTWTIWWPSAWTPCGSRPSTPRPRWMPATTSRITSIWPPSTAPCRTSTPSSPTSTRPASASSSTWSPTTPPTSTSGSVPPWRRARGLPSVTATSSATVTTVPRTTGARSSVGRPGSRWSRSPAAARTGAGTTSTCSQPSNPTSTGPTRTSTSTSAPSCASGWSAVSRASAWTSPMAWSRPRACPTTTSAPTVGILPPPRTKTRPTRSCPTSDRPSTSPGSTTSTASGAVSWTRLVRTSSWSPRPGCPRRPMPPSTCAPTR